MKSIYTALIALSVLLFFSCGKKTNEVKPERKNITETVFASGTLEPENKYNLTAQTEGYLIELRFESGDTVKAGQVLAVIDNKTNSIGASSAENLLGIAGVNAGKEGPTLKQAEQNVNLLREKAIQDSIQFTRYQKLFQSNSVSKLELENAKLAGITSKTNFMNAEQNYRLLKQQTEQQLIIQQSQRDANAVSNENNEIKAVVGGKIYKRLKEVGDYVRRGDVIAVIGDAREMYARLNIDEGNIANIKAGQKTSVQLNSNKGLVYEGYVFRILPAFEENTQSFICEVKFTQKPELQISGTQLQANIITGTKTNALVIPRKYLDYGNKVNLKSSKEPVIVKTGFVSSEWVEITEGLTEADIILNTNK